MTFLDSLPSTDFWTSRCVLEDLDEEGPCVESVWATVV